MTRPLLTPYQYVGYGLVLVLSLALAACGFQPRGATVDLSDLPSPLYIGGISRHTDIHRELRKQLQRSSVPLAESAQNSALMLRISDHETDTRLLSVDSLNRGIEFELEETVSMVVYDRDGKERLAPLQIRALRIWFRPPEGILGSGREEELLREDMRKEIAQRVLNRLATLN